MKTTDFDEPQLFLGMRVRQFIPLQLQLILRVL